MSELLPPHLLERLGGLEVIARTLVEGSLTGLHPSVFRGGGREFDRHRPYQQGDEARHIDWRLFARTDRLHVREFHDEANLQAYIIVDATASMGFADRTGLTKLRYAQFTAAALAHLMLRAGDAVGLVAFDDAAHPLVPPRNRRGHLHALLLELEKLEPRGTTSAAAAVEAVGPLIRRRGRVILISDLLEDDDGDALLAAVGPLRARGDEVIVIRPLTPVEAGHDDPGLATYYDPERPSQPIPGDPGSDPGYRGRIEEYYGRLSDALAHRHVEFVPVLTTTPVERAVSAWVRERTEGR